jgi:hypothetical protein
LLSTFRAVARISNKFAKSNSALMAASKFALAIKTLLMASVTALDKRLRSAQVGQSTLIYLGYVVFKNYTPKTGAFYDLFWFIRKCPSISQNAA